MKEAQLRKYHRNAGIVFALLIFIQALTGLILTVEDVLGVYWGGIVHSIHKQYDLPGHIYRLAAGAGLVFMVSTGVFIWFMVRQRTQRTKK